MLANALSGIEADLIEVAEKFRPQWNALLKEETDTEIKYSPSGTG